MARRAEKATFVFIASAAVILLIVGLAKIGSAFGSARLLEAPDPIFNIPFGFLFVSIGIIEICIALCCAFCKATQICLYLLAWLATSFAAYRFGLWWMNWHRPCSCLGNLSDALHIPPQTADTIMKGVLAYLLIGSYGLLLWHWSSRRRENRIAANPPERVAA